MGLLSFEGEMIGTKQSLSPLIDVLFYLAVSCTAKRSVKSQKMLLRRSFPEAPSQQQVPGIHAKQILIINIELGVAHSLCFTCQ